MVTSATSLTRSGLSDWLVQRVSAVILAAYTLCVTGFLLLNPQLGYVEWVVYFGSPGMKLFTTVTVLATAAHAWIGMWTVATDYIRPHYFGTWATTWRFLFEAACVVILFAYVAWGLLLVWRL